MSKYSTMKARPSNERKYELIRAPIITEKSTLLSEHNQVSFRVPLDANKLEIKQAVEKRFDVKVEDVRTLNVSGKLKRQGRHIGRRAAWKKAIVTLKQGDRIELVEGV